MNNSITYRLPSGLRINKITIGQKELVFQLRGQLSHVSLQNITGVLAHLLRKNKSYLRAGLFAVLGVMLIGLIYKVQLTNIPSVQIPLSHTSVVLSVIATLILSYSIHYQYAFAKAYHTFNPFYGHHKPIHKL